MTKPSEISNKQDREDHSAVPEKLVAHWNPSDGFAVSPSRELHQAPPFKDVQYIRLSLVIDRLKKKRDESANFLASLTENGDGLSRLAFAEASKVEVYSELIAEFEKEQL